MNDPDNTPIYPTAADRQCLKLSGELFAARLVIKELEEQVKYLTEMLNGKKETQCTQ